jgi:predicted  nucleic acid-binding Zn-ribbon protein
VARLDKYKDTMYIVIVTLYFKYEMINPQEKVKQLSEKYPFLDFSLSVYQGAKGFMTALCPKHGSVTKRGNHWNVNGCPQCGREKMKIASKSRMTGFLKVAKSKMETARLNWEAFAADNEDWLDTSMSEYKGTRVHIEVRCKIHDYLYSTSVAALMKQKSGCKFCGVDKIKLRAHSEEINLQKARNVHGNRYVYLHIPRVIHDKAEIRCETHGVFIQSFHNHVQGMGCPSCVGTISSGERELFEYVKSLGVTVEDRNRKIIAPKELDIYLPEHHLAVEYHGLHWHADDRGGSSLREKYLLCKDAGVRLIQIFEDEWINKSEIVKDLISAAVGKRRSLMARKTEIAEVPKEQSKYFLEKYHISGNTRAEYRYGLYHDDYLVAVMTLGKPRFGKEDLEVIRFATSAHIAGGFDKLFRYAVEQLKPTTVVSYADLRFGHGDTYVKAGFSDQGDTPPDYWWFKKQERLPRYRTQKHKLSSDERFSKFFDATKTEAQICTEVGYRKISGVGHRKMIWSIINPVSPLGETQPG